jgi:hypothetical protein
MPSQQQSANSQCVQTHACDSRSCQALRSQEAAQSCEVMGPPCRLHTRSHNGQPRRGGEHTRATGSEGAGMGGLGCAQRRPSPRRLPWGGCWWLTAWLPRVPGCCCLRPLRRSAPQRASRNSAGREAQLALPAPSSPWCAAQGVNRKNNVHRTWDRGTPTPPSRRARTAGHAPARCNTAAHSSTHKLAAGPDCPRTRGAAACALCECVSICTR